jgi:membrane associated rhomboid family serine protease
MWDYYKRTFLAVQLVTGLVGWMVYRSSNHLWIPTAMFVLSMEISAIFGAMWANRLRRKIQARTSCAIN